MSTSKRDAIKRKHKAAHNSVSQAMEYVLELKEMFQEPHPKYAEGYQNILVLLDQAREFISVMKGYI